MSTYPKEIRHYCVECNGYNAMRVTIYKASKASPFSWILRNKARKPGKGNKGKFSKVPAKKVKTSKRYRLDAVCQSCKKLTIISRPRANKFKLQ